MHSAPLLAVPILVAAVLVVIHSYAKKRWFAARQNRFDRSNPQTGSHAWSPSPSNEKHARQEPGVGGQKDNWRETIYLPTFPDVDAKINALTDGERNEMPADKILYRKLQNLEHYPDAMILARKRLVELLSETLSRSPTDDQSILSIKAPSADHHGLRALLANAHAFNTQRFEAYIARRRSHGPREMFPTVAHARRWLAMAAVVKYVDGAWLSGVLRAISDPQRSASERHAAKLAWQVVSEEFGDGDLAKNHVALYYQLVDSLRLGKLDASGKSLTGDQADFDECGLPGCWKAAIAQACIGACTPNFLPEALGFNMAYETLPYHLLVTVHELKELKIDNYYFALHVTIDNSDSGHAAMSRVAVERYLDGIADSSLKLEAWRRVQAGFVMAEGLPTTPWGPKEFKKTETGIWVPLAEPSSPAALPGLCDSSQSAMETASKRMAELMLRKAPAAEKLHCPSRILISGSTVEQWLDPSTLSIDRAQQFLSALSDKKSWIMKGDPQGSRLVKEIEWGGRMFGAFSRSEVAIVKGWVQSLGQVMKAETESKTETIVDHSDFYWKFTGRPRLVNESAHEKTPSGSRPSTSFKFTSDASTCVTLPPAPSIPSTAELKRLSRVSRPFTESQLPLLLTSVTILDDFPLSSCKFASPLGMTVLQVVRAWMGYPALHRREDICAGLDEDEEGQGIWEIAMRQYPNLELHGLESNQDLKVLQDLRRSPYANADVLLGLALGFVPLLEAFGSSLESLEDRMLVEKIAREVEDALDLDAMRLAHREEWWTRTIQGCALAKTLQQPSTRD